MKAFLKTLLKTFAGPRVAAVLVTAGLLAACGTPSGGGKTRVDGDGFRALAWGDTPDRAAARYPDLVPAGYALPEGDTVPTRVYVRESEDRALFGVTFDRVEYGFREERPGEMRLRRVTARLHGTVGPRTLRSRCEAAYDRASESIVTRFGGPTDDRLTGTLRMGRWASWRSGPLRVVLSRSVGDGDSETLSLEISRW